MTAAPRTDSDLKIRTATGLIAAVVALGCLWLGGAAFWLLVAGLSLPMLSEWCGLVVLPRWKRLLGLAALAVLLLLLLAGELGHPLVLGSRLGERAIAVAPVTFLGPVMVLAALVILAGLATLSPALAAGLLYVGLPAVSLLFLRTGGGGLLGPATGFVVTLLTLLIVWATDIGAYFAGRAIGGAKLAPRISPNKTWAGLVGGMAAAALISALVAAWLAHRAGGTTSGPNYPVTLALGAGMAILAQAGDLFESWLKRRRGVKDSGQLLPGHGGALDRLDGLVPVSVAMALLLFFGHQ